MSYLSVFDKSFLDDLAVLELISVQSFKLLVFSLVNQSFYIYQPINKYSEADNGLLRILKLYDCSCDCA